MSPLKKQKTDMTIYESIENWERPISDIEDIIEERFDIMTSDFFMDYIYDFVFLNEGHWIYKVFIEMQKINETGTLEEELREFEERIALAEYRNDEICPYIQKIIWRFIKEEM